jgi:hypothetical protein
VDLSNIEAFADLPDDEREKFALAADVVDLRKDDEVSGFALALVVDGEIDVEATIVDTPAAQLSANAVLRSRGTTESTVPVRLVCASALATVATWKEEAVHEAFHACPWVEDDLRAASDRVQALVGLTSGPLGERLDPQIRADVFGRFELRVLLAGEVVVEEGKPMPGLVVLGVGEIQVVSGDQVERVIRPGEFVFPEAILGGGAAPATARAGKGGAVVMTATRATAQELLVTCPPLLELFAGM